MTIYHLANRPTWDAAQAVGVYHGSPDDHRDGFIHFSTAAQVAHSAAKHRAGQRDLLLLWVDADALGDALRWERSGSGELYPHVYASLPTHVVKRVDALPLDAAGNHVLPRLD